MRFSAEYNCRKQAKISKLENRNYQLVYIIVSYSTFAFALNCMEISLNIQSITTDDRVPNRGKDSG